MNASPFHRALWLAAGIAGVFCLLVCATMVYEHFAAGTNDPWKSPQLLALKDKLAAEPRSQPLQTQIRQLDQSMRRRVRLRLALDKSGAWLLLGGALALVLAAGTAAALQKTPPMPQPKTDAGEQSQKLAARARRSLAGVAAAVAGTLLAVGLVNTSVLPANQAAWQKLLAKAGAPETPAGEAPDEPAPALADLQNNWPRFRGWDGSGAATQTNFGTNLAWRSAIPAPGHNSPIVWGDRVFISGGTEARREVFCYNVTNGALLWQRAVENVPGSPPKVAQPPPVDTTWAASTLATDGRRVYAIFGNGDLGALNFDGAVVWTKYLGPLKNSYGYAASLAMWANSLLVQLDAGDTPDEGSKLISLQGASGRLLWERSRPVSASWATPIVVEAAGRTQIITLSKPLVIAYAPADGAELWRSDMLGNEVVPSPVLAGGLVVLFNPGDKLLALRADGAGDVTNKCIVWSNEENVPDIPSPAARGDLLFTVTSMGMVKCFEAVDGKKNWETNLDMEVKASPGIAGDRLVVLSADGLLVMLRAGRALEEFGRIQLEDKFTASPAFAGGRMFLRGATNLFCLGPVGAPPAKQP
jgi:outer membrane protein assembly factor BamB